MDGLIFEILDNEEEDFEKQKYSLIKASVVCVGKPFKSIDNL